MFHLSGAQPEKRHLHHVLRHTNRNISQTAENPGIGRQRVYRQIRECGLTG